MKCLERKISQCILPFTSVIKFLIDPLSANIMSLAFEKKTFYCTELGTKGMKNKN